MMLKSFRMLAMRLTGLALASVLGACAGDSEQAHIAAGKESLQKKDGAAAIIQFKSALQKNPQSGEARFLLGEALLANRDAGAAALELEKAREAQFNKALVLPVLAEAYLMSGQSKKITDGLAGVDLGDLQATSRLKTAEAAALVLQGNIGPARSAVDAALQLNPKNAGARLLQSRLIAGSGDFDQALASANALLADEPKNTGAWNLKGELLWLGKADLAGAAQAFRQALSVDPSGVDAHFSLIRLLLQQNDAPGVQAQFASLKKLAPNHPETRFFEVQLALQAQDFKRARESVQQLLLVTPDNPYVLQLAGAVEFRSGVLLQAETFLSKALNLAPDLIPARRMLAETYLRRGQPPKALATLQPLLASANPSAETLALAAECHLQAGDFAKSEQYYGLAVKADPDDAKVRVALALSQVSRGNTATGFAQLESLAASDSGTYADLALIAALSRKNETEAALKAIDRLQAKLPDKALSHFLRGQILIGRGDKAGARTSFERAQAADAVYLPAVVALANLDIGDRAPEEALKRYEALLTKDPKNVRAALAVAELRRRTGAKPEDVNALIVEVVKANPADVLPRLALVDTLLSRHQVKAALSAAQEAVAALPDNLQAQDALGRAQLAGGDVQQALTTFRKIVSAQPALLEPHLRLAEAFIIKQDHTSAAQSFRRALEISPNYLPAQQGLVRVAMLAKQPGEALRIARALQKERPGEPAGYLMEVEIHMAQRAWDPAIAALRSAFDRNRTTDMAKRVHALYSVAGREADAQQFAASWTKSQPRDADFVYHLATMALGNKDHAAAEALYRQVLTIDPNNAGAVNNIAWLMLKSGQSGALPLAERANQLLPDQPAILDTLAMAFAAEKQWPKAIETQKKAIDKAPGVAGYRLNLARMLIDSGDKTQARSELEQLRALGDKFSGQAEVTTLMGRL